VGEGKCGTIRKADPVRQSPGHGNRGALPGRLVMKRRGLPAKGRLR